MVHKNQKLEDEMKPREEEIEKMENQINEMNEELERYWRENENYKMKNDDLRMKVHGARKVCGSLFLCGSSSGIAFVSLPVLFASLVPRCCCCLAVLPFPGKPTAAVSHS